jgi:flagellar biosynthetic protein FlhB
MFGVAVAANLLQTGPVFLPDKLLPDWSHINPLTGFQRLFSLASAVRLSFGLIKISLIGAIAGYGLWQKRGEVLGLVGLEIGEIAFYLADTALWMALKIAGALLLLAILDYGFQRWKYERDLRMTPQEVREEMKDLQGDPHIIARRRQVQRQLALSRLKSAVPTADVVVTNPTELAIAIRYDAKEMAAPIVVAKGAGVVAQRIRELAAEHQIPIVENKPLARLLYKEVDVNHPIPDKAYAAVAEVLAYVYQLKGKTVTRAA